MNNRGIITYKQKALTDISQNTEIVKALAAFDKNEVKSKEEKRRLSPSELFYTHIFPYGFIPDTITEAGCYIGLEISVPETYQYNKIYRDLFMTFTIICHQDMMKMKESEGLAITGATRLDYITVLLLEMFNNASGYGTKPLDLISNTEMPLDLYHRMRMIRYKTQDLVDNLCQ